MSAHLPKHSMRLPPTLFVLFATQVAASDENGLAEAGAASHHGTTLEEVIVTAQRREQPLQEVPVSASVFSAPELERLQVHDVSELQYVAPNLVVAPNQSTAGSASIAMRGQVEQDTTPTVDPAVGLYLDGVYIARMTGANLDLVDLERVEVLRGPQGTLFGRNTIGGAINLVPNPPQAEFAAQLKARVGNYDLRELTAVLNAPLSSVGMATRLTAMHREHSGYAQDTLLDTDLADADTDFARLQLQFALAPDTQLNLAADFTRSESGSQYRTMLAVFPGSAGVTGLLGNPNDSLANYVDPYGRDIPANRAGTVESTVWGASATLTSGSAPLTFKSITAYRTLEVRANDGDQDATPYDLGVIFYRGDDQHQFSEELQLFGRALRERLDWIGGLLFFDERAIFSQRFEIFIPTTSTFSENRPWGEAHNRSLAAYGQLSYALTPRFSVTAGARYNEDRRQLTSRNARSTAGTVTCRITPGLLDQAGVCVATRPERTFTYVPFTVGLEFRADESTLVYAKLSEGYRAGGYNLRGTNEVDMDTFEPEKVDSYELGLKSDLFHARLRMNLALFRTEFKDIQLVQRVPVTSQAAAPRFISNGGEAHIDGGELELTALLGRLRLTGALGIARPKFTELAPEVDGVTLDSAFPFTPERTASVAADLPIPVAFGSLALHADYSWRDDVPFAYDRASLARQDAYGLLNMMVSANFAGTSLELSLWARNLTDQDYITRAFESDYYVSATPGDPRTYGVSITYQFGSRQ